MSEGPITREVDNTAQPEPAEVPGPLPGPLPAIDTFQQRHPWLAVPIAVVKKFGDDDAGKAAALISYFAFLSVFPLLIVLATVLSRVLAGNPELADEIVNTAAGSFLSVGSTGSVEPLDVSGVALVIGILVGLWAGLAVANAMQDAMDTVYEVPKTRRAGFIWRVLRSLSLLVIVGVGLPATTVLQGLAGRAIDNAVVSAIVVMLVVVLNTGLIAAAFRRATNADTSWRGVLPGALIAAIAWSLMQALATSLLTSRVAGAENSYGAFAIVIGLLFWFFLLAQVTIYCAELNVVLAYKLWPRGLKSVVRSEADTEADIRAYGHYPAREQLATNMQVTVEVVESQGAFVADEPRNVSR